MTTAPKNVQTMLEKDTEIEPVESTNFPAGAIEFGMLQTFIESVQDYAIFLLDAQGHVASWNRGAERIKQYTAAEIIGKHLSTFYTPADVETRKPWRALEIAATTGKYEEEGWRMRKSGARFWASVIITPVFDPKKQLIGYGKVTRDKTEKRIAEEALRASEERNRNLIANVKEYAIFMLDPKGNISSWNAGAERMKGYSAAEVIGRHFSIFYTDEDLAAHKPENELEVAIAEGKYEEQGWRLRKDKTQFLARVLITPVYDEGGKLLGFTKITRDITDEREAERVAESLRIRDLFLSVVAHELRTPITSVRLQTDTLKRALHRGNLSPDEVQARLHKYFRLTDLQTERLNKLVNDLLELSRINSSALRLDKSVVDLAALIKESAEVFALTAEQAGNQLQLELAEGIRGEWDKTRIEQVITNLLNNALRHAPKTLIRIATRLEGGAAVIEVTDEGPGIPDELIGDITKPFVQADGQATSAGLGIGLFITQNIVAQHGGTLVLQNRKPQGLSATVCLPVSSV
jgi:PAS domain S-box-containing protein